MPGSQLKLSHQPGTAYNCEVVQVTVRVQPVHHIYTTTWFMYIQVDITGHHGVTFMFQIFPQSLQGQGCFISANLVTSVLRTDLE